MGSIVPVALQALQAVQTVSTVAKVVGRGLDVVDDKRHDSSAQALAQLEARQRAEIRNAKEQANIERQKIASAAKEKETERLRSLKRAVARQRAEFGGSGIASGDGSSQAVLLGLFDESEQEKADRERLDKIKLSAIDQSLANKRRVNTLERAQLQEKSRLKNSRSTLEEASDFLSIF